VIEQPSAIAATNGDRSEAGVDAVLSKYGV